MWNPHMKGKHRWDWHLSEYTEKLFDSPFLSKPCIKENFCFYYENFSLNFTVFTRGGKKMKSKEFPNSRVLYRFGFKFLNFIEKEREIGVETFERHFIRLLHQIIFTICLDFYKDSKPALIININLDAG